jgi:hypothetical protein
MIGCQQNFDVDGASGCVLFGDYSLSIFTGVFVVLGMGLVILVTANSTLAIKLVPLNLPFKKKTPCKSILFGQFL